MNSSKVGVTVLVVLFATLASATDKPSVMLWADAKLISKPGKYEIDGHPCGGTVTIATSTMPQYVAGADLTPEQVYEISIKGQKLRTWRTPVDTRPVAIDGSRLLVQNNRSAYWISTGGNVASTNRVEEPALEASSTTCAADRLFPNSGSAGCVQLKDKKSGKPRIFAYQGVCS